MLAIKEDKAPWVMYERRAVEDRAASIAQGHYVARDEDWVLVTPYGSKDQIERVASEWFANLEKEVSQNRFPSEWFRAFKHKYDQWKEGLVVPDEGIPLINWPVISPGQVRMCQDLHILTVEKLAGANEEVIRRLGMGARELVQKARDYLSVASHDGKVTEEITAIRAENNGLKGTVKALQDQVQALVAAQQLGQQVRQPEQELEIAGGLLDDEPPVRKL